MTAYKLIKYETVLERLEPIDHRSNTVYPVPRGGMCAAALLKNASVTTDISVANVVLDDIYDSGATAKRVMEKAAPNAIFHALFDKRDPQWAGQWLVMPWESALKEHGPEDAVIRLLEGVGEDPNRDGLKDTPRRVVKAWREMTVGYAQDPTKILSTLFEESTDQLILVKDIPFSSLCEHHVLPFTGRATVGYLPTSKVVGLSKIPRLVHAYARRLQVQERMTNQIAEAMLEILQPKFVGVIVTGHHTCMSLRGVGVSGNMVTSAMLGELRDELKAEFLQLASP